MDRINNVVKVETNTPEHHNIHGIFSKCGEIRALHLYKDTNPGNAHFFIEFKNNESTARALNLKLDVANIHVYSLAVHPQLVDQYRTVNPSAFEAHMKPSNPRDFRSQRLPTLAELDRGLAAANGRKVDRAGGTIRPVLFDSISSQPSFPSPSGPPLLLPTPGTTPTGFLLHALGSTDTPISNHTSREDTNQGLVDNVPPSRSDLPPLHPSLASPLAPSLALSVSVPPPASLSPVILPSSLSLTSLPVAAGQSFSLESHIIMALCGEVVTYDLHALEPNPQAIIELLRLTASERGNWMIVGAYYRRTGNAHAAITVVTTMIEVLTQHQVPEDDLKPAFLMLSGCESDLGKHARSNGANAEVVSEHHRKSQQWLQKVYGADKPVNVALSSCQQVAALAHNFTCSRCPNPAPTNIGVITGPINTATASTRPPVNPHSPVGHRQHSGPARTSHIPTPASFQPLDPSQLQILKREIQSLRDREAEQTIILVDAQSKKRKLEEDFACERSLRRKLERRLDAVEQERETARRMEKYALDQVRREVETRRRAEQRAGQERAMRREVERLADKRAANPLEDLANMFQRAVQRDGMNFAGTSDERGPRAVSDLPDGMQQA